MNRSRSCGQIRRSRSTSSLAQVCQRSGDLLVQFHQNLLIVDPTFFRFFHFFSLSTIAPPFRFKPRVSYMQFCTASSNPSSKCSKSESARLNGHQSRSSSLLLGNRNCLTTDLIKPRNGDVGAKNSGPKRTTLRKVALARRSASAFGREECSDQ